MVDSPADGKYTIEEPALLQDSEHKIVGSHDHICAAMQIELTRATEVEANGHVRSHSLLERQLSEHFTRRQTRRIRPPPSENTSTHATYTRH